MIAIFTFEIEGKTDIECRAVGMSLATKLSMIVPEVNQNAHFAGIEAEIKHWELKEIK